MDLIIDGYNLIGAEGGLCGYSWSTKETGSFNKYLRYQRRKRFNVIVVFDGWRAGRAEEIKGETR
jgi:predicted RNA-binding protein with PIN domain